MEQVPFGTNNFADNPDPRAPCVLLLDVSGSMRGEPIKQLNEGVVTFKDELTADSLAAKRVEVAIVTFGGGVQTACDFTTVENFRPPTLTAGGETPMGAALQRGIEMVRMRKDVYKANGVGYFRPWMFLITDGGPTDPWQAAATQIRQGDAAKAFSFFAVGVEGANFEILKQISPGDPLKLKELRFRDLFRWLSTSLSSVSRSNPGQNVQLTDPTGPKGWGVAPGVLV
jgi:uncharacterized protein YegL